MWYFIALVWVALVAGIFWFHGRARRKARGVRERELDALMLEAQGLVRRPALDPQPADPAISVQVAPPAATASGAYAKKSRLLDKADALIYLLLRTGLPDHEIFAALTLADISAGYITSDIQCTDNIATQTHASSIQVATCDVTGCTQTGTCSSTNVGCGQVGTCFD